MPNNRRSREQDGDLAQPTPIGKRERLSEFKCSWDGHNSMGECCWGPTPKLLLLGVGRDEVLVKVLVPLDSGVDMPQSVQQSKE